MLGHVLHGVRHAAVQRNSAPGTLEQDRHVLRLDRARGVLALPDLSLSIIRVIDGMGGRFLCSESVGIHKDGKSGVIHE